MESNKGDTVSHSSKKTNRKNFDSANACGKRSPDKVSIVFRSSFSRHNVISAQPLCCTTPDALTAERGVQQLASLCSESLGRLEEGQ